jgi:hypothetical protein
MVTETREVVSQEYLPSDLPSDEETRALLEEGSPPPQTVEAPTETVGPFPDEGSVEAQQSVAPSTDTEASESPPEGPAPTGPTLESVQAELTESKLAQQALEDQALQSQVRQAASYTLQKLKDEGMSDEEAQVETTRQIQTWWDGETRKAQATQGTGLGMTARDVAKKHNMGFDDLEVLEQFTSVKQMENWAETMSENRRLKGTAPASNRTPVAAQSFEGGRSYLASGTLTQAQADDKYNAGDRSPAVVKMVGESLGY